MLTGRSPEHGSWRQTGPLEIISRSLTLAFEREGGQKHVHFATVRVDIVWEFDDATFRSGMLTLLSTDVFLPDQDPLDPNEVPIMHFDGGDTSNFRRIDAP